MDAVKIVSESRPLKLINKRPGGKPPCEKLRLERLGAKPSDENRGLRLINKRF